MYETMLRFVRLGNVVSGNDIHDLYRLVIANPARRVEDEDWEVSSTISNSSASSSLVDFQRDWRSLRRPSPPAPLAPTAHYLNQFLENADLDDVLDLDAGDMSDFDDFTVVVNVSKEPDDDIDGLSDLEEHQFDPPSRPMSSNSVDSVSSASFASDSGISTPSPQAPIARPPQAMQMEIEDDPIDELIREHEEKDALLRSKPCNFCFAFHGLGTCRVLQCPTGRKGPEAQAIIRANREKLRATHTELVQQRRIQKQLNYRQNAMTRQMRPPSPGPQRVPDHVFRPPGPRPRQEDRPHPYFARGNSRHVGGSPLRFPRNY